MKKTAVLSLVIMLLAAMLVMTGCGTKATSVEFTVEGYDAVAVIFADAAQSSGASFQRQVDPNDANAPAIYTINLKGDKDYALLLVDANNNTLPFTLKLHDGKVETVTPEGVTVKAAVK